MITEAVNCPSCGAALELNDTSEFVKCRFCNNTIRIQRRKVNTDGSTTIIDKATGMVLGTVRLPFGYQVFGLLQPEVTSYTYPFAVSVSASSNQGNSIAYFIGESYTDKSKCPALSGPYSQGLDQISRVHYRNFVDVLHYVDGYASMFANTMKATGLKFLEERQMPLYEPFCEEEALQNFKHRVDFEKQRIGNSGMVKDVGFYLKGTCRIYELSANGVDFKLAISTVLEGWKYQLAGLGGGFSGFGGGVSGLTGLSNSLFGHKKEEPSGQNGEGSSKLVKALFGNSPLGRMIENNRKKSSSFSSDSISELASDQITGSVSQATDSEAFSVMMNNSVVEWQSEGVFTLLCLPQEFETAYRGAFTDFCSTFRLAEGVREKMYNMQAQILQDISRHTQQRIDQMNRQFQTWQQIHATQQAAFDSYNKAWWTRTNESDAARRASYLSKLSSEERMSDRYSEAVRGVNTYVRPDGTEVEVSVMYDRAYTNNAGDVLGSRSAFEPGGNFVEMERK